jgi:hypothetical protein
MSVQVLCPACGYVAEVHRPPITECARCHAPLPEELRLATERALARERVPKPLLLTIGQWLSLLSGTAFLLSLLFAPFDLGTYTIGEDVVSGPEFLRRAGVMFVLSGGLLVAIGVGLWRVRQWVRPLMIGYWLLWPLLALADAESGVEDVVGAFVFAALAAGIAVWYLYRKSNVRTYFEARAV